MSDIAISVQNLGKKYVLSHQGRREGKRYVALRDVLMEVATAPFRKISSRSSTAKLASSSSYREEFWALKDVSFEVKRGEAVGIIGRNGAGKSTLLKLLSRITKPTRGRIEIDGRVASLLEVGTGFHPELTGSENIYLNGAILGMPRAEIKRKFDEIVAFAEVEKFLDTPVKRYSSGMYMRLAFAVAAHLESNILVIDEVLAVGDAEFQKKCLSKMENVSKNDGRTVLFVSHNLSAVRTLCKSGILLESGKIKTIGDIDTVLDVYSNTVQAMAQVEYIARPELPTITRIAIDQPDLERGDLIVDIGYQLPAPIPMLIPGVVVSSPAGMPVFGSNPVFHKDGYISPGSLCGTIRMSVINPPIFSGTYKLSVWLSDFHQTYDCRLDAISFDFKPHQRPLNLPNLETIGYLDPYATWRGIGSASAV